MEKPKVNWLLRINNPKIQKLYREYQRTYVAENLNPFFLIIGLNGLVYLVVFLYNIFYQPDLNDKNNTTDDFFQRKKDFIYN